MTTPRPHAELAARQSVTDELRLAARNAALAGINGWGNLCSDAADTIDIECEAADGYVFSSRFQKPHWFVEAKGEPS